MSKILISHLQNQISSKTITIINNKKNPKATVLIILIYIDNLKKSTIKISMIQAF